MRARFSIVGYVASEIKFDPGRGCADFTIQVAGGRDRFHVTSVSEDEYLGLQNVGTRTLLGIVGYFVEVKNHVALKPQIIYVLDVNEVDSFRFVDEKWMAAHLLAGVNMSKRAVKV